MTMRQGQSPLRRSLALGPRQCQHLAAVVAEFGPNWSVVLHDDIPGDAAILIMPMDLDDTFCPTLFVHRAGSTFHLEELGADTFRKLGEYRAWADVIFAVRSRLLGETPCPATLH
jgi:hypothetical protein